MICEKQICCVFSMRSRLYQIQKLLAEIPASGKGVFRVEKLIFWGKRDGAVADPGIRSFEK